jgi:hypothetical protein
MTTKKKIKERNPSGVSQDQVGHDYRPSQPVSSVPSVLGSFGLCSRSDLGFPSSGDEGNSKSQNPGESFRGGRVEQRYRRHFMTSTPSFSSGIDRRNGSQRSQMCCIHLRAFQAGYSPCFGLEMRYAFAYLTYAKYKHCTLSRVEQLELTWDLLRQCTSVSFTASDCYWARRHFWLSPEIEASGCNVWHVPSSTDSFASFSSFNSGGNPARRCSLWGDVIFL